MSRTRNTAVSLLTATILLVVLVAVIDPEKGLETMMSADLSVLGAAFVLANSVILVNSIVWREVLKGIGVPLSYTETVRLVLANTFINNITPFGNTGGEPIIAYYISKRFNLNKGRAFSAVLTADIINFSPLITSGIVGMIATSNIVAMLLLPVLGFNDLKVRLMDEYRNFRQGLSDNSLQYTDIAGLTAITHISVAMDILAVWLVLASLGLNVALLPLLFIVPLARVANYTPSPGGTGPYELALSGLLVYFYSIPAAGAVSAAVLYRAITYYFGIFAGFAAAVSLGIDN